MKASTSNATHAADFAGIAATALSKKAKILGASWAERKLGTDADEIGIALGGETAYTMSRTLEQILRHYRQRPQPHKRFGA